MAYVGQVSQSLEFHVGGPKTGSSFLQAALAMSVDLLESEGIYYPPHESFERARRGHVSSGNIGGGASIHSQVEAIVENSRVARLLFSNETLVDRFGNNPEELERVREMGVVTCYMFVRDLNRPGFGGASDSPEG